MEKLRGYEGGGEMIERVSLEKSSLEKLGLKLEGGSGDYVGREGVGKGMDYVCGVGMDKIGKEEEEVRG